MGKAMTWKTINLDMPIVSTAYQLTTSKIYTTMVEFHTPAANGGSVYVGGDSTVNATDYIPRVANTTWSWTASDNVSSSSGDYIDLSTIYALAATAGDNIIVQYLSGT